jgi:YggT family protein
MAQVMGFLSSLVSLYMIIVFIRIILSWFTGIGRSGFQDILAKITDPYLNWFRRFPFLRTGFLDFSPIVALGVLSLINSVFSTLAHYGTITIGIVLAMILQVFWGAASFVLGFLIIVLGLCLIARLARVNMYSPFWRVVDAISQPVLYRISRIFFKNRIVKFTTSVGLSIAALVILYLALKALVVFLSGILARTPL